MARFAPLTPVGEGNENNRQVNFPDSLRPKRIRERGVGLPGRGGGAPEHRQGKGRHWEGCPGVFRGAGQERHGQRRRRVQASALSGSWETQGFHLSPCDAKGREFAEAF